MARPQVRDWLEPRLPSAPEELAAAIRACVERAGHRDGEPVPEALARAALQELERVIAGPQTRAAALRLLAADAILTYAFEAAAELGHDLRAMADRLGPAGRLGRRLAEAREAEGGAVGDADGG